MYKPYVMKGEPKLIFNEEFNTFDLDLWKHTIKGEDFVTYVNNRTNSFVQDGKLFLQPTLAADTLGEAFLKNGTMNLN